MPLPQERRIRLAAVGHWVAKAEIPVQNAQPVLTIIEPASSTEEEGFSPAQSLSIYGKARVIALRDFLDAVLDDLHEDSKPEVQPALPSHQARPFPQTP